MLFRGIKSRVFIQFWFLFLIALLFIDLLIFFFVEERMVNRFIDEKQSFLTIACEYRHLESSQSITAGKLQHDRFFGDACAFFYLDAGMSVSDRVALSEASQRPLLAAAVQHTLESGTSQTRRIGSGLGWLLPRPASVIITYALQQRGKTVAAGGVDASLTAVYTDLQRIQKVALVFVVINSFFFALFGNRQLSRIYFKPLKRLARRAESYEDENALFFSVRKEDNEFAVLSASLNKMLNRIAEDRRMLKETIDSLTAANAELKQARNDVIRAEKLATVGRLTSGIAHEIGNPIGIVLGYLDLLKQPDLDENEHREFIARSEKEITRIHNIIRQMLDMSRSSGDEAKAVSIHDLIQDLISVFSYQPSASEIHFETHLDAGRDTVVADPDRLRQVFLNILLNAVDAVTSDGVSDPRIVAATRFANFGDTCQNSGDQAFIEVSIQDNGPGIDPEHLPRIFDPFFTTKAVGKGTGLGLSVADMIIEKLGGKMTVSGNESGGVIFRIVLPLASVTGG